MSPAGFTLMRACAALLCLGEPALAGEQRWESDAPVSFAQSVAEEPATAPGAPTRSAPGAGAGKSDTDLANQLANPVSSLISVPLQFNYDEGYGPKDAGRLLLNVQPVVPLSLNEDWNVIVRTILPVIYQDSPADGVSSEFGLGDTTQSFFFAPKEKLGGWIIGVGPALVWPTATDAALGSEKWGAGPTIVALRQEEGLTYGALANHIWSYAGDDDRGEVNATFLQPFVNYTFPTATSVVFNTETTYDWSREEWSVPLNLMVSQLVNIGGQRVQFSLGGRWWVEAPDDGPEWGVRFVVTFLFPE